MLADGVSAVKCGGEGARLACETVIHILLAEGLRLFDMDTKLSARLIIERVLDRIKKEKCADCPADCASTLAFVLRDKAKGRLLTFSLGDTLIYAISDQGCRLLSHPDADSIGRCCVTTTRGAFSRAEIEVHMISDQRAVMLCTDGAWQSMYEEARLSQALEAELMCGNYAALKKHLIANAPEDDCSFIVMNLTADESV